MSWQTYVDSNLIGTGKISNAMILGQKGGVWAASSAFKLSPEEEKAVLNAYKKPDDVQSSGLRLAGQKYFVIQAGPRSIYLKKQGDGAVIVKTERAILIAQYVAPVQAGEVTPIVETLADYLIQQKF